MTQSHPPAPHLTPSTAPADPTHLLPARLLPKNRSFLRAGNLLVFINPGTLVLSTLPNTWEGLNKDFRSFISKINRVTNMGSYTQSKSDNPASGRAVCECSPIFIFRAPAIRVNLLRAKCHDNIVETWSSPSRRESPGAKHPAVYNSTQIWTAAREK